MKFSHSVATIVAAGGLAWAVLGVAQNQPGVPVNRGPAPTSNKMTTSVAVVDVKFVFDNLNGFKAAMDKIKQSNEAFEASVRDQETVLRKQLEQLKTLTPGSEPFKQLEEQISHARTQTQLDIQRRQKGRVEEEASVYHRAYQEVEQAIKTVANRYAIDLVLQHSTTEIDPSKPDTVIRGLNRLVLYQQGLNITTDVLTELNRGAPPPPATTAAPVPNRGGPPPRTGFVPPSVPPATNRK